MKILNFMLVITLIVSLASLGFAEETKRTAAIISLEGGVDVQREGDIKWIPGKEGMVLNEGDVVRTKEDSRAILELTGIAGEEATVEVEENSLLMLAELIMDEEKKTHKTLLDLAVGKILIKAKEMRSEESDFEVKTPTSVVGIRGTVFVVEVEAVE